MILNCYNSYSPITKYKNDYILNISLENNVEYSEYSILITSFEKDKNHSFDKSEQIQIIDKDIYFCISSDEILTNSGITTLKINSNFKYR